MSEEQAVVYAEKLDEGIEVIVLNQPQKKNAISGEMMDLLHTLLLDADVDESVRVIILRGAGDNFSSGGDLNQSSPDETGPEYSRRNFRRYLRVVKAIRQIAKPVIAMVDGYAIGGAFSLVLVSDLVCASSRACFVPAFCQIGIVPEMGMTKYLQELVGPQRAKEILFFGGKFSGERMYALGLVNCLFSAESLEAETLAYAKRLSAMPDASIQITKGIMNSAIDGNLDAILDNESTASPFCTTTEAYAKTMEKFAK